MPPTEECPRCGEMGRKVNLSSRIGRTIDVEDYDVLHQVAERRQGGPTMKKTRADSEKYKFVGYLH